MKPIYIFRHVAAEGPGYFGDYLEQEQIPYQLVCLDAGDAVPTDLKDCSALVFMGGPMSVNDKLPWIDGELALIRQAFAANMPVLGHCLGGQLMSKALGGEITANPVKEYGWHDIYRTESAVADEWLHDLPRSFPAFHWHGETFSIPAGATNILSSQHCPHQGFVIGNSLALQCHVEMTATMVKQWAELHADEIRQPSPSIQTYQQLTDELEGRIAALQGQADKLYRRWLQPLMP